MHALHANKLRHTSGHLDRVGVHSDLRSENQVRALCLRMTKMYLVSTKNKQHDQERWRKRAEGQQQTLELCYICKLAHLSRKSSCPIVLLMPSACSTISASMMT
jgi:hypothetical protein